MVEQTECLKSWIKMVMEDGGFCTDEVADEVLAVDDEPTTSGISTPILSTTPTPSR